MTAGPIKRILLAAVAVVAVLAAVAVGAIHSGASNSSLPPYGFPHNGDGRAGSDQRAFAYRATATGRVRVRVPGRDLPSSRLFYTGWGGWEPSLGVSRRGIFYGSYSTVTSPVVLRSTDGGKHWSNVVSPVFKFSLDPYLWVDPGTGRVFDTNLQPSVTCPPLAVSGNGGDSWTNTTVCGHFDHETIFTGPVPAGGAKPSGYPHVVYYCAINGVATAGGSTFSTCSKTLDGGTIWVPTGAPAYPPHVVPSWPGGICDGATGHGAVGPDGTVYLPRAWCGPPYLAISHDEGQSWTRVRITHRQSLSIPRDGDHETGVAVDTAGNVYYTWVAANHHVYLSVSRDDGRRWSKPLDVEPPGVPTMSAFTTEIVAGGPGRIALLYTGTADRRGTPMAKTTWNDYVMESTNALSRRPLFYAVALNNPRTNILWRRDCGDLRCGNMGDFLDLVIGPDGRPYAAIVDACPGRGNKCTQECGGLDNACPGPPSTVTLHGEAAVGSLVGGPDLLAGASLRTGLVPAPTAAPQAAATGSRSPPGGASARRP
jgi:hypothetical protein